MVEVLLRLLVVLSKKEPDADVGVIS